MLASREPSTVLHADRLRAEKVGRTLGRWCWNATGTAARMLAIASVLAVIAHAFVPGMPVGAYLLVFIVADCLSRPVTPLLRALREAHRERVRRTLE